MNSRFKNIKSNFAKLVPDEEGGCEVYHVYKPHLLIQACGYLKYYLGKADSTSVYYRGQSSLYKMRLEPAIYRHIKTERTCCKRIELLKSYVESCKQQCNALKQVSEYAWEPLLQHYGIKTRWIDVVDNVWVALWFACYKAYSTGRKGEFLHFEKRQVEDKGKENFAYILLLQTENIPTAGRPGLFEGSKTRAIDLRIACPSTFLRPHAQHGLLIQKKSTTKELVTNYSDVIVGVVRIALRDAFSWLGDGVLLTNHVLFPSPVYDFGYRDLLNFAPEPNKLMGAVQHVGT